MRKNADGTLTERPSEHEAPVKALRDLALSSPAWQSDHWYRQVLATLHPAAVARLLFLDTLYRQLLDKPGFIAEFGVHYGATLGALASLRGIYEPHNHNRLIVGFDTFQGLRGVGARDAGAQDGDFAIPSEYIEHLSASLRCIEQLLPYASKIKHELVVGDVVDTLPKWLEANAHATFSLVLLDLDIYEPTRNVLELILPRMHKGAMIVFDEFGFHGFPGETKAFIDTMRIDKTRMWKTHFNPYSTVMEVG